MILRVRHIGPACLGLLLSLGGAGADAQVSRDCSQEKTQLEVNFCAQERWARSDFAMNRRADELRAGEGGKSFAREQGAWAERRERLCKAERRAHGSGPGAPEVFWTCMERVTEERRAELRARK